MNKIIEKIKYYNITFIIFKNIKVYSIYFLNKITNYKLEKLKFYKILGYQLNLKTPKTFNEKTIWKKIYDRNPLLPITADKLEVRSYVRSVLGEEQAREILIPLLYVTDRPESIPFERLPDDFVVKPNHASGLNIMVRNGQFDKKEIIKTCKRLLSTPYGMEKMEWAYQAIKRKIIIEQFLCEDDGSIPKDFKFDMFHGKCKRIRVVFNRMGNHSSSHFDEEWNFIPVKKPNRPLGPNIEKPKNFARMLEIAEKLSKPFDYVRVDFYNVNGKIYFGELTHYSKSGNIRFNQRAWDLKYGLYWNIEEEYWKINKGKDGNIIKNNFNRYIVNSEGKIHLVHFII